MNRTESPRIKVRRAGGALFLLALVVRLVYLWEVSRSPTFRIPIVDAGTYDRLARSLASGKQMSPDFFWQVFFYPYFLSFVYSVGGSSIVFAKIVQAFLGSAACVLVFLLGRKVFDIRTGVTAGLIAALYGPFIFFDGELLATGWATLWAPVLILLLMRAGEKPGFKLLFVLGLCGGLSVITRATFLSFVAVAFLWLAFRLRRADLPWRKVLAGGGILAAGFLLVVVPVAFRCHRVTGRFSFLPETGAVNLYIGNNGDRESIAPPRPGAEWVSLLKQPILRGIKERGAKQRFFLDRVIDYAASEPILFLRGMLRKTAQFFTSREIPNNLDLYEQREYSKVLSMLMWKAWGFGFPFGVLLPLTLLGLFIHRRDVPIPFFIFLLVYPLSIILVFVTARYRAPVAAVMAPPAAAGFLHVIDTIRSRRWRKAAGPVAAVLVIAVLSSIAGPFAAERFDFEPEMHFCIGAEHQRSGRMDEAAAHLKTAIQLNPDYGSAYHQMGMVLYDQGKFREAAAYYGKAVALRPGMDQWHFHLGQALFQLGNPLSALLHYQEAAVLNPYDANYHVILGDVLSLLGRNREALESYQKALELEPGMDSVHYNMGCRHLLLGEIDDAVRHLEEAHRLNPEQVLYSHNLASTLTQQGRLEEAVHYYEKALAVDPTQVSTRYDLGKVLHMLGRTGEAVGHWKKALEWAKASGNRALAEEIEKTIRSVGG